VYLTLRTSLSNTGHADIAPLICRAFWPRKKSPGTHFLGPSGNPYG